LAVSGCNGAQHVTDYLVQRQDTRIGIGLDKATKTKSYKQLNNARLVLEKVRGFQVVVAVAVAVAVVSIEAHARGTWRAPSGDLLKSRAASLRELRLSAYTRKSASVPVCYQPH
jgi:hypothetical protein